MNTEPKPTAIDLIEARAIVEELTGQRLAGSVGAVMASKASGPRSLSVIAAEIIRTWKPKVYYGAVPYLEAMTQLDKITDKFYEDDAKSVVLYFLANAQTWRGEDAKRIKAELKKLAGIK